MEWYLYHLQLQVRVLPPTPDTTRRLAPTLPFREPRRFGTPSGEERGLQTLAAKIDTSACRQTLADDQRTMSAWRAPECAARLSAACARSPSRQRPPPKPETSAGSNPAACTKVRGGNAGWSPAGRSQGLVV